MQLSEFSDIELCFFYFYKLGTYMPDRQKALLCEIKSRGFNEDKLLKVRDEIENMTYKKDGCPRCKSSKNQLAGVSGNNYNKVFQEIKGEDYGTKYHKVCSICGWDYRRFYWKYLVLKKIKKNFSR